MTDRSKFEEMLERLVNEDQAGAEELFHEIVVEKSREIYQSILENDNVDDEDEEVDEASEDGEKDEDDIEEASDDGDDAEDLEEMFGLDEFAPGNGSDAAMGMGGDGSDDMMGDVGADDGLDGDTEGDMEMPGESFDLQDQLAELKAQFDKILAGIDGDAEGDEMGDDDADDAGDDSENPFGDDDADDAEDDGEELPSKEAFAFEAAKNDAKKKAEDKKKADAKKKSEGEQMREYVEKVSPAKMGDNGVNTKSPLAGKNDMGGTTANILSNKTETGTMANQGQLKGNGVFKGTPKDMNTKNVNVPGAKNATKLSPVAKGHGAEKKGAGETADKSAGSMLNGAPKRAK